MTGRWLALDTSSDLTSVAVGIPPEVHTITWLRGQRVQAAQILDLVDRTLRGAGVAPRDLAGVVVGDGPGSFTGLRVGWAAAKGLVQEADLPLHAIPALMALGASAVPFIGSASVAVCFDALRGQVYGAIYRIHADRVETVLEPGVGTVAEFAARAPERPRLAVGDGAVRYAETIAAWTGAPPVPPDGLRPAAALLLELLPRTGAGAAVEDPATAEPAYGRPAEAQAKWEAHHGRPLPHPTSRAD